LHRAAGTSSAKLVELHGTNAEAVCMTCLTREPVQRALDDFAASGRPPRCLRCGGSMKPGVVMFGEALDPEQLRRAHAAAARADLVLALGSSLVVTPAANVPLVAVRKHAPYVIVNRGATPHDSIATLKLEADVNELLPAAVARACGEA
jgi:NAD-dependent deacetylase